MDWSDNDKLGDKTTNVGLRKYVERRSKGLRAMRQQEEALWLEVNRFASPMSNKLLSGYVAAGPGGSSAALNVQGVNRFNSKLMDARAVWASEVLGNGMYSGLTNSARPWFKLKIEGELGEYSEVKLWLDEVEKRLYDLFSSTNFYTAAKGGYAELGNYGVEAGIMERHWRYGMVCHPLTAGEYWLGVDDGLVVDTLMRRCDMTALQHCQRFLKPGDRPSYKLPARVVEAYDKGDYDHIFPVFQMIEPNDTRQHGVLGPDGMAWRSIYWSEACEPNDKQSEAKALLAREGFKSKPFWAPRWETRGGGGVYSAMYPGLAALADTRQLQLQALRKQQATDFMVKPPLAGPATLTNVHTALQPGRITAMANVNKDNLFAIWEITPQALQALREDILDTREAIDRDYYADLFNAITNMRGIQPRNVEEIASRNEEKLTQLGPVVERVNQEKLGVVIDRGFEILMSSGMLADLPMPEELVGQKIEVEFISVLAQAQRLIGLGAIERTFGFAASIAEMHPEALDRLDADAAMEEYGDITGVAAKIIRTQDAAEKLRATRQQQMQQAQAAEQMAAMAPAAKAGAETAQLLFDSPGTGTQPSLADRLLGMAS